MGGLTNWVGEQAVKGASLSTGGLIKEEELKKAAKGGLDAALHNSSQWRAGPPKDDLRHEGQAPPPPDMADALLKGDRIKTSGLGRRGAFSGRVGELMPGASMRQTALGGSASQANPFSLKGLPGTYLGF